MIQAVPLRLSLTISQRFMCCGMGPALTESTAPCSVAVYTLYNVHTFPEEFSCFCVTLSNKTYFN